MNEPLWSDERIHDECHEELQDGWYCLAHVMRETEICQMRDEYETKLTELRTEIGRLALLVHIHFPEAVKP